MYKLVHTDSAKSGDGISGALSAFRWHGGGRAANLLSLCSPNTSKHFLHASLNDLLYGRRHFEVHRRLKKRINSVTDDAGCWVMSLG